MALHRQLNRLRRMHNMIKFRRTGTPQSFADKMGISLSLLYKLLAEMKEMGAPINFCHLRQSYEYYEHTELRIGFFPKTAAGESPETIPDANVISLWRDDAAA